MINYGEDIAYWYLRLNGFFPLSNFVLHGIPHGDRTSDVDILALRPPFTFEVIGGQEEDWDRWLFDHTGTDSTIGLICEVKTGEVTDAELFRDQAIRLGVPRLGLVAPSQCAPIIEQLRDSAVVRHDAVTFVKLLIATYPTEHDRYLSLPLDAAQDFIAGRADKYRDRKQADRLFFPTGAFQFEINASRRRANEDGDAARRRRPDER